MDETFRTAEGADFSAGDPPSADSRGETEFRIGPVDGTRPDSESPALSSSEIAAMYQGPGDPAAAVTLDEADFLLEPPYPPYPARPGPGLAESLLWLFGFFAVQVMASIGVLLAVLANYAVTFGLARTAALLRNPSRLEELLSDNILGLFAGIQFAVVVAAIGAGLLRLGKDRERKLPLQPIPLRHCALLGLLIVPLVMFCGQLYGVSMQGWESIIERMPQLTWLNEQGSMQQIEPLASRASLGFLLVAIAIVPAVAEELVFRGIIGRGLVARWGLLWGILITSALFAAMHVHPAHAFALIPLAVAMHVAYLSTRSFWAPMAIHFINNAWAAVAMKTLTAQSELIQQPQQQEISWPLLAASGWCVVTMICLIWQTRVRYVHEDGVEWNPGYVTAETPPPEAGAMRCYGALCPSYLIAALSGLLLFAAACVYSYLQTGALEV